MNITRETIKETLKAIMAEESDYQTFFKKALEKAGKSIPSMSDEEKKEFFNKIDAAWNAKGEKNEGNAFGAAVTAAKEKGEDEFEVGGKTYKVESVNEEETFTATNKETGKTSVFKSKDARDAAVKAGTHAKKDEKDVDTSKGEEKPNMFSKDSGYDAGGDSEPKKKTGLIGFIQKMRDKQKEKELADRRYPDFKKDAIIVSAIDKNDKKVEWMTDMSREEITDHMNQKVEDGEAKSYQLMRFNYYYRPVPIDESVGCSCGCGGCSEEVTEGKKLKQVKKDKYGNHLEPQFKKGELVTYLGYPAIITRVNKEMGGVYSYDVDYNKGYGRTKVSNIFNKSGNELKESVNEAASDRDFEKIYSIFDKKDYFHLKGSIKTMLGNWQRALDKGDKGAAKYTQQDVIDSVTASTKARAKQTYDSLVKAIKDKDIKSLKSKLRHDQPFSIAIFTQVTGKKLPKSTRDIHSFLDNEFMNESLVEGRAFVQAARKAKEEGKTEFEFNGKTYPVTLKEEAINERRLGKVSLLRSVEDGETSRVEGVKLSKDLAFELRMFLQRPLLARTRTGITIDNAQMKDAIPMLAKVGVHKRLSSGVKKEFADLLKKYK